MDKQTSKPLDADCTVQFKPFASETIALKKPESLDKPWHVPVPKPLPEYFQLNLRKAGYARYVQLWEHADMSNNIPHQLTIVLQPGSTIGGVLQDLESGKPLPGITLELLVNGDEFQPAQNDAPVAASRKDRVTTDANGHWKSEGMPSLVTNLSMQVVGPELVRAAMYYDRYVPMLTNIVKGQGIIEIREHCAIQGKVGNQQGQAIAGARVEKDSNVEPRFILATTKADGSFEIPFRHWPVQLVALRVQAPGYVPQVWGDFLKPKMSTLEFKLANAITLNGQVVDMLGRPVAKAYVALSPSLSPNFFLQQTETDAQGRFHFIRVPAGQINIVSDSLTIPTGYLKPITASLNLKPGERLNAEDFGEITIALQSPPAIRPLTHWMLPGRSK